MWRHRRQLETDVERWREAGWVTPDGAAAILEELRGRTTGFRLPAILALLGAVLLGFAAMSFVAANWQEMSKLARLGMLAVVLWGFYGLAAWLFSRRLDMFAEAAVLAGVGVFGASIMLISQMYHIEGHPPDAVLLWAAGALLAGLVLGSSPSLVLSMLLAGLWSVWETSLSGGQVHWPFLAAWAIIALAFVWHRWQPGLHVSALAITPWIIWLGYLINDAHGHGFVLAVGIAGCAAAIALEHLRAVPPLAEGARVGLGYAAAVSYAALFGMQFVEERTTQALIVIAAVSLILLLAAIVFALRTDNRPLLWVSYVAFSIEVMSLYFKSIGTLLGLSLFFLSAGLVVIALAFLAYRLHARSEVARRTT
jgi:uncharacterized membrane protein